MHMQINGVLIMHIEYLFKFFIQQDVNVKLKTKCFYTLLRKQCLINIGLSHVLGLNHFQNKILFAIDSEVNDISYTLITIQPQ